MEKPDASVKIHTLFLSPHLPLTLNSIKSYSDPENKPTPTLSLNLKPLYQHLEIPKKQKP